MVTRTISFVLMALLAANGLVFAEDVRATAHVDSNTVFIGDWLTLYVDVQHAADKPVKWPSIPDSLEGFEIVHRNAPSVKNDGTGILESATFTVTAFDSGVHVIPPLVFQYTVTGDTVPRSVETSPIPIFVRGIAVDTTAEIKDIKPPLGVPISFMEMLPYLVGALGLGGIIWLIYYVIKKRRRGEKLIPAAPPRPPHEIALEALHTLEAERLWQRGKVKEYHTQLTDIVRTYIERKYGMLALEMTTDEILSAPALTESGNEYLRMLKEILVRGDLVKFAKLQPLAEENETSLSLACSYVELTSSMRQELKGPAVFEEAKV